MSGAPVLPGEGLQLSLSWVFHLGPSEEWRRMQGNAAFAHVPGRVFVSRGRRTVAISDHLRLSFAFHFLDALTTSDNSPGSRLRWQSMTASPLPRRPWGLICLIESRQSQLTTKIATRQPQWWIRWLFVPSDRAVRSCRQIVPSDVDDVVSWCLVTLVLLFFVLCGTQCTKLIQGQGALVTCHRALANPHFCGRVRSKRMSHDVTWCHMISLPHDVTCSFGVLPECRDRRCCYEVLSIWPKNLWSKRRLGPWHTGGRWCSARTSSKSL